MEGNATNPWQCGSEMDMQGLQAFAKMIQVSVEHIFLYMRRKAFAKYFVMPDFIISLKDDENHDLFVPKDVENDKSVEWIRKMDKNYDLKTNLLQVRYVRVGWIFMIYNLVLMNRSAETWIY